MQPDRCQQQIFTEKRTDTSLQSLMTLLQRMEENIDSVVEKIGLLQEIPTNKGEDREDENIKKNIATSCDETVRKPTVDQAANNISSSSQDETFKKQLEAIFKETIEKPTLMSLQLK